jgi:hypothetical protein
MSEERMSENLLVGTILLSYFQKNLGEPILLNVFLLGAFFPATDSQ